MTQPPDWVTNVPSTPDIHREPAKSAQWQGMSQDQVSSLQKRLLESIIQVVVQAITGLFIPGGGVGGASNQLTQWATDTANSINTWIGNVVNTWNNFWDGIFGTSGSTNKTLADFFTAAGSVSSTASTANTNASTAGNFIQTLIDDVFNWFTGSTGSHTNAEAAQAIADQAATTADLATAVAALQQQATTAALGGQRAVADFSQLPNSTNLPLPFTNTYSNNRVVGGAQGSGTYGVVNGRARIIPALNNPRSCVSIHSQVFDSDYQVASGIWTSTPGDDGFGNRGYHRLVVRSNAAGNTQVDLRLAKSSFQLGFWVGGVRTIWATGSFSFKNNTAYSLVAGTIGGPRNYQVMEGSKVIFTYGEVGTSSQLGPAYRMGGTSVDWYANVFASIAVGDLAYWTMYDNAIPSTPGSGATMSRSSSSTIDVSGGVNLMPTSFMSILGAHTADIIPDVALCKYQVTNAGWYTIDARVKAGSIGWPNSLKFLLFKGNGAGPATAWEYGGADNMRGVNSIGTVQVLNCAYGHWEVPLQANDYVRLAYDSTNSVADALTGESTGLQTKFTIALTNKSLN